MPRHIAEIVAGEAARRGHGRLGLTRTRWLVEGETSPEKLAARGIERVRPSAAEREESHRIIMDELVLARSGPSRSLAFSGSSGG
ncbi:hypothetical protein WME89_40195 [Sorangium sp. So ce321]